MNYWLIKSDPEAYSWQDLVNDGSTSWTGVRNYAARNHLRGMKKGDFALVYHSTIDKAVIGIAKVTKEAYTDTTVEDEQWSAVDIASHKALKKPVGLVEIKKEKILLNIGLIRIGRLSVMPLKKEEFEYIVKMGS